MTDKNPLMTTHNVEVLDLAEDADEAGSVLTPITDKRGMRKPLERIAMAVMALGAVMMFQPFALALYSYSFIVFLAGTVLFTVAIHLPE